jgi:hypothetical protein
MLLSSSSELSSNSGEEDESPTGRESEDGKCKREESVDVGVIDPLMEADMNGGLYSGGSVADAVGAHVHYA